ncbi:MAG: hypothetical protein ABR912_11095 [Terracidiphilus sp.]|jgi:hypothetical protein
MRLFNRPRGKAKTPGPEEAAEELYAYSRIDLNAEILPEGAVRCRPSINANFKFTRTAIIIQWLQRIEKHPSRAANAGAVLKEFEKLTFGGFEPKTIASLTQHLGKLMDITDEINALMSNRAIPEGEAGRGGLDISKKWFEIALDDPNLVARATVMHGAELIFLVHEEMKNIGEMVGNAVSEEGKK